MPLLHWLQSPRRPECRRCQTALPDAAQFCFFCGELVDAAAEEPRAGAQQDPHAQLRARLALTLDGRYRVRDVLGVGGMGVVFLADDIALDRAVAIKVLSPELSSDQNAVSRFRREAGTASRLDHPGIVPIYKVESAGGLHYFVMKYVAGRSLEQLLSDESRVSIKFATRVLSEAAAALAHAHRNGVVHRDVKPDNIMLDADDRVMIADFGISKVSTASSGATTVAQLTQAGGVIGTPHYMAPEHALGQAVDGRTDQYSLAVVGFRMLTGRVPFDDETTHAIVHLHISEAPPKLAELRRDVPPHLAAAISRAMSKAAANRYASMEEFAAAVTDTKGAKMSRPASRPTKPTAVDDVELDRVLDRTFSDHQPARNRRRLSWAALAMVLLATLAGSAAWVGASRGSSQADRGRSTGTRPAAARTVAASASKTTRTTTARRTAMLSVGSSPRATLFIDGKRIGETPIGPHSLTVGRAYQIRLERKGYRTKRDTITAKDTRALRRSYLLERSR